MPAQPQALPLLGHRVMHARAPRPTTRSPRSHAAPFFVVSPHLDDAVFSCGILLASHPGSIVCTVFCGVPLPPRQTPWDRLSGHRDSSDALRARIDEDERALAVVGAHALRLPFLDSQYGETPPMTDIVRALTHAWRASGCARLVAPLGLYHSDHVLVGDACRALVRQQGASDALFYEDALYRTNKGVARARHDGLAREGWAFAPLGEPAAASLRQPGAANAKWRAVRAYRSQLRALSDAHPHDLAEPERYLVIGPTRPPRQS